MEERVLGCCPYIELNGNTGIVESTYREGMSEKGRHKPDKAWIASAPIPRLGLGFHGDRHNPGSEERGFHKLSSDFFPSRCFIDVVLDRKV